MAVDSHPLIAQPGQVKQLASAIDERVRLRLSTIPKKPDYLNSTSDFTKQETNSAPEIASDPSFQAERPKRPNIHLTPIVLIVIISALLIFGFSVSDPLSEILATLEISADLRTVFARLKSLEHSLK